VDVAGADLTNGTLLELHIPCPPFCGELTQLNASSKAVAAAERRQRVSAPVELVPGD
jgi:hypothetical protein